jgi:hypothetical protein
MGKVGTFISVLPQWKFKVSLTASYKISLQQHFYYWMQGPCYLWHTVAQTHSRFTALYWLEIVEPKFTTWSQPIVRQCWHRPESIIPPTWIVQEQTMWSVSASGSVATLQQDWKTKPANYCNEYSCFTDTIILVVVWKCWQLLRLFNDALPTALITLYSVKSYM